MKKAMIALLLLSGTVFPAAAEQMPLDGRVKKLEKEMRAVQRKVFPDGARQYLEPEIKPAAPAPVVGTPADTVVVDLTRRVDALERSLAQLTGQVETNGYKLRQLEEKFNKLKGDAEFRLNVLEGKEPGDAAGTKPGASLPYDVPSTPGATAGGANTTPADAPMPPTAELARDAYLTGYKLWEQKKYPEAIAALQAMYTRYPKDKYASYARNLAGRAYLDSGKYNDAIREFFENTKFENGDRAPHSYVYMAQALMRRTPPLPDKACQAYEVLQAKYPDKVTGGLAALVEKGKAEAKCQ